MNNLSFSLKARCYFVFYLFFIASGLAQAEQSKESQTQIQDQDQKNKQTELLKQLEIDQGKGTFVQNKYFKFLSQPIVSKGEFILSEQSALWQTQVPIFSQLLLTPKTIYTRRDITKEFKPLIDNASFSQILSTLLSGKFKESHWQKITLLTPNCISLTPVAETLKKIFMQVQVCFVNNFTRKINLTDTNDNKTEITMILTSLEINEADSKKLSPINIKILTP